MTKGRVVHVAWSLRIGGIETMLVNLANVQAEYGMAVKIVIINNQIDEELASRISEKVEVVRLNRSPKSRSPWSIIRLNCELFGADIIHCHSFTIATYVLPIFRRKLLLTIHTTDKSPKLTQKLLKKYRTVASISEGVQRMLKDDFATDSIVVYNGIDTANIRCKEYSTPSQPLKIVQLGRLIRLKGHHTLIDAIAKLPADAVWLDIIGDGEERTDIEQLIEKNNLQGCVRILGQQSQHYVFEHLADYDLLVQPSIVEGFGLTVAEAMTAGIPVLVSDIEGLREVVACGKYGRMFTAEDSESCAMALQEFIKNPPTCEEVLSAKNFAMGKFDIHSVANGYIDLYKVISR